MVARKDGYGGSESLPAMMEEKTVTQRALATVCVLCPLCIAKRRWPGSLYARTIRRIERFCPFCRAYLAIRSGKGP